eukprot:ANDGO_05329.mRNA.1 hydrolase
MSEADAFTANIVSHESAALGPYCPLGVGQIHHVSFVDSFGQSIRLCYILYRSPSGTHVHGCPLRSPVLSERLSRISDCECVLEETADQLQVPERKKNRILFIQGLGTPGSAWQFQVDLLLRTSSCEILVFDNRGCGFSSYPKKGYKTSEMARDTLQLLTHVGWLPQEVHIVGFSLGGMIAQELALLLGNAASLSLLATHCGGVRAFFPPLKGVVNLFLNSLVFKKPEQRLERMLHTIYQREDTRRKMRDWHVQRIARYPLPPPHAFIGQSLGALTHFITSEKATKLRALNCPKLVIGVCNDNMVRLSNSVVLADLLHAECVVLPNCGHNVPVEESLRVTELLIHNFAKSAEFHHCS